MTDSQDENTLQELHRELEPQMSRDLAQPLIPDVATVPAVNITTPQTTKEPGTGPDSVTPKASFIDQSAKHKKALYNRYRTNERPRQLEFKLWKMHLRFNPVVSFFSILIIWGFIVVAVTYKDFNVQATKAKEWIGLNFGWLYIGSLNCWVILVLTIYFSKYNTIRLGKDDEEPEYSDTAYFTMLFAAGIGPGMFYFAVGEPIKHYSTLNRYTVEDTYNTIRLGKDDEEPEYSDTAYFTMLFAAGIGPGMFYFAVGEPIKHYSTLNRCTVEDMADNLKAQRAMDLMFLHWGLHGCMADNLKAQRAMDLMFLHWGLHGCMADNLKAQRAMDLTFLHWGIHGWCVYVLVGMLLALMSYKYDLNMTIRTCFYPLLGVRIMGFLGDVIDIFSVVCTMFGVCTSLGIGVIQLAQGLCSISGGSIDKGETTQTVLIWAITAVATISVVTGMKAGIKFLSIVCFVIGLFLMFIVFFADDTFYILGAFVQNVGSYVFNVIPMGTMTDAYSRLNTSRDGKDAPKFMNDWTIYYYGWWVSWSPFVGMFIAKISRGRLLKDYIFYTLTIPCVYIFVWFTIFGSVAISVERNRFHRVHSSDEVNFTAVKYIDVQKFTTDAPNTTIMFSSTVSMSTPDISAGVSGTTSGANFTVKKANFTENRLLSNFTIEEMLFEVMSEYKGLSGFLSVLAMTALILYFVTSSDSGSMIIDCLTANGIEEPPMLQRIFWSLTEGACATALLISGGKNALESLRAVALSAGLVYLIVINFMCLALWRSLRMEAGDINPQTPSFFTDLIDPFYMELTNRRKKTYVKSLFVPWAPLSNFAATVWQGKRWHYMLLLGVPFCACVLLLLMSVGFHVHGHPMSKLGYIAATFYVGFSVYASGIRSSFRQSHDVVGNTIEDFFTVFLAYPLAIIQMDEQIEHFEQTQTMTFKGIYGETVEKKPSREELTLAPTLNFGGLRAGALKGKMKNEHVEIVLEPILAHDIIP